MSRKTVTDSQASAFIAACLAPLPADAEPAATKKFLRQAKRDHLARWRGQMLRTTAIERCHKAAAAQRALAAFKGASPFDDMEVLGDYVRAVDRQMRIAAPSLEGLRWKRARRRLDGGRPEWDISIAADEARLGVAS